MDDDLFSLPEYREGRHRRDDHATSIEGANDIAYRAGSQKARLLDVFRDARRPLTDEEAAIRAGLEHTCYWKRCGELREDGHIKQVLDPQGNPVTRTGAAGVSRIVSSYQETPTPLRNGGSITGRTGKHQEVPMLTERQADILMDGQRVLVEQVARALDTEAFADRRETAERVINTVADWLSDYRPQELGAEYVGPLDMTAFILRRGQRKGY